MPFIVWRNCIHKDLQWQRRDGFIDAGAPELIAERGKQQRRRLSSDTSKRQHASVITPGDAVRSVIDNTDRQFGTPNPRAASRTFKGTINNISSVVRVIVGIIMMPSATPPERAEKCFCGTTMSV